MVRFELQFDPAEIESAAERFGPDDAALSALGQAVRARGHYTRAEFLRVARWKSARSAPLVARNSEEAIVTATGRALSGVGEAERMEALLALTGVGVPTASTLLFVAFPEEYPILDVRALDSLGVKARSTYPVAFWLEYLAACRAFAAHHGVSLRTLDKALWQMSKERAAWPGDHPAA